VTKNSLDLINWYPHKAQALTMPVAKSMRTQKSGFSTGESFFSYIFYYPIRRALGQGETYFSRVKMSEKPRLPRP
jgi:hypothetical protein